MPPISTMIGTAATRLKRVVDQYPVTHIYVEQMHCVAGKAQQMAAYGLLGVAAGMHAAVPSLRHASFIAPSCKNAYLIAHLPPQPGGGGTTSKPSYKQRKEAAIAATRAILGEQERVADAAAWLQVLDAHLVQADLADAFLLALAATERHRSDTHQPCVMALDVGTRHLGVCVLATSPHHDA